MRALLLAAGLGTRLRPLTDSIPKCLVPINGVPLLGHWFDLLFGSGIDAALVNLHYLPDQVEKFIQKSPYKNKIQMVYEEKLLGTAGTLLENKAFFQNTTILLVHADNYSIFNLSEFIHVHQLRPQRCDITMMTFHSDEPQTCGIVELDNENVVQAFHEKVDNPPGNIANGAVYILEASIFDFLKELGKKEIDFSTEVLPHYLGKIYTYHNHEYHRDIGTPESYQKAEMELRIPSK